METATESTAVPLAGDIRTVTWMKGRHNTVVTWQLGKIGVVAREADVRPRVDETWTVEVLKDTAPGERGGVLVLLPLEQVVEPFFEDGSVDESLIENAEALVELAVVSIWPSAEVKVSRSDRKITYLIHPPENDPTPLPGRILEAIRMVASHILSKAGAQCRIDVADVAGAEPAYAACESCGTTYADLFDYEARTLPGGVEDRFERGQPVLYSYRTCKSCMKKVYVRIHA